MITINNLTVSYRKNKKIISNLNLDLADQMIHGIVGMNGAGKTTLLNTLFGLIKANEGSVIFNNKSINKKDIAYLLTENYFYPNITGSEYLNLIRNDDFDIYQWNQLFSLPLDNIIDTYSTGMKKKLALMGILKQNKAIIILDEPFNGLDIEAGHIIRMVLLRLKEQGKTIIITSHIIETLTNLCDNIHYLEEGCIKYSINKEHFSNFEKEVFEKIENKNSNLINQLLNA
nr:ATP-binding cassette domain-containing protein [uncultured Carboxylicivirga sp.]